MNIKDENIEWEKEAPTLAGLSRTMPYKVPEQYFDHLQSYIHQAIFVDNLMQKEDQGFSVPQNYFEGLGTQIESRIAADQIHSLVKNSGFKTPPDYFSQLQTKILTQTSNTVQKNKTIRLWQSDFMRYASAACFIMITASVLYFNQQSALTATRNTELANEQMLYNIDESVILEHIQQNTQTSATVASDVEMESYILDHLTSSDLTNNL